MSIFFELGSKRLMCVLIFGAKDIKIPEIDRLMNNGVRFTANCCVYSPLKPLLLKSDVKAESLLSALLCARLTKRRLMNKSF